MLVFQLPADSSYSSEPVGEREEEYMYVGFDSVMGRVKKDE